MAISWAWEHQDEQEASARQNIVYVEINVDDVRYHGCALNPSTDERLDFHCRPT